MPFYANLYRRAKQEGAKCSYLLLGMIHKSLMRTSGRGRMSFLCISKKSRGLGLGWELSTGCL